MRTNGNYADGDDLFQATALRALDKARQFTPGSRFDNWAYAIATSIWLNELRSRKIRLGEGVDDLGETDIASEEIDAVTNIFASQVLNQVMALPDGQKLAVLLVYVEGNTYNEAAKVLDVPVGTIMSRLAAARKKLKLWAGEV